MNRAVSSLSLLISICFFGVGVSAGDPPRGARGEVVTVVEGVELVAIPVRMLGRYPDAAGPGFDLFLVELEGPLAEQVGVASGMSGSPVYFDGELLGALSYRYGLLSRKPVGGVTPREDLYRAAGTGRQLSTQSEVAGARPIATPIQLSGTHPDVRNWLDEELKRRGYQPVAGSGGPMPISGWQAKPGMPVGMALVRGDWVVGATGTITAVEGDRVFAFGHPVLGTGSIEVPMTEASVVHTLADALGSTRLTRIGATVGSFEEDRLTAVVGRESVMPRMMPLDIFVRGGEYGERDFHFEIARETSIAPLLAGAAVSQALTAHPGYEERQTILGNLCIKWSDGSRITRSYAASGTRARSPILQFALELQRLLGEIWADRNQAPDPENIELHLEVSSGRREYTLRRVLYERRVYRPGEVLQLQVVVDGFRSESKIVPLQIQLPLAMPPGEHWTLRIGSAVDLEGVAEGEGLRRAPGESLQAWRMRITDGRGSAGVLVRLEGTGDRWSASSGVRAPVPGTLRRLIGSVEQAPRALLEAFAVLDGPLTGSETIEIRMLPGEGL